MIMADVIGGAEHPEPVFVLSNDRIASRGIHDSIARKNAGVFREQFADGVELMIIDREAVPCRERADGAFRLQPFNTKREVIVGHFRTMTQDTSNVQNGGEKEGR